MRCMTVLYVGEQIVGVVQLSAFSFLPVTMFKSRIYIYIYIF